MRLALVCKKLAVLTRLFRFRSVVVKAQAWHGEDSAAMNKQLDCLKRNPSLLLQTRELVLCSYAKTIDETIAWVSSVKMSDMVSYLTPRTVKSLVLRNIPLMPEIFRT
jgi:hypothetical protein